MTNNGSTVIVTKKEEFRKYLEQAGILSLLTKSLAALYSTSDKPSDALGFVCNKFVGQNVEDLQESLKKLTSENKALVEHIDDLMKENKDLKEKVAAMEAIVTASEAEKLDTMDPEKVAKSTPQQQVATPTAETKAEDDMEVDTIEARDASVEAQNEPEKIEEVLESTIPPLIATPSDTIQTIAEAKAATEANAETKATEAETMEANGETKATMEANAEAEATMEANAEAEATMEAEAATEDNVESEAAMEAHAKVEAAKEANAEASATEANTEAKANTEANADAEAAKEANTEAKAAKEANTEAKAAKEVNTEAKANTEANAEAEAATEANSESEMDVETKEANPAEEEEPVAEDEYLKADDVDLKNNSATGVTEAITEKVEAVPLQAALPASEVVDKIHKDDMESHSREEQTNPVEEKQVLPAEQDSVEENAKNTDSKEITASNVVKVAEKEVGHTAIEVTEADKENDQATTEVTEAAKEDATEAEKEVVHTAIEVTDSVAEVNKAVSETKSKAPKDEDVLEPTLASEVEKTPSAKEAVEDMEVDTKEELIKPVNEDKEPSNKINNLEENSNSKNNHTMTEVIEANTEANGETESEAAKTEDVVESTPAPEMTSAKPPLVDEVEKEATEDMEVDSIEEMNPIEQAKQSAEVEQQPTELGQQTTEEGQQPEVVQRPVENKTTHKV